LQRAQLVTKVSHERGFGKAFLEQRERALVVPEAASSQLADSSGCGASVRVASCLAPQFAQLGELVCGEQRFRV
jgi:hypothetical protein